MWALRPRVAVIVEVFTQRIVACMHPPTNPSIRSRAAADCAFGPGTHRPPGHCELIHHHDGGSLRFPEHLPLEGIAPSTGPVGTPTTPALCKVWMRGGPLEDLGPTIKNWRHVVGLGLILGGVQFFLTLYGYQLPAPVDWVPLLTMALMVGHFEAIFFRGFAQRGSAPASALSQARLPLQHCTP